MSDADIFSLLVGAGSGFLIVGYLILLRSHRQKEKRKRKKEKTHLRFTGE